MILFTRALARDFRTLFARCVAGRPRGPAPPVVVRITGAVRTLAATTAEGVTLTHASTAPKEPDDLLVLPASVLAEVEGGADGAVTLDRESKLRGVLRWPGGTGPRTRPVELILPGKQHERTAPPALSAVPAKVLAALHECGRTAAKESGRYALSKVQVQGKNGRVVGTDGRAALLWAGFTFPFPDDVLVPAVPVFGSKPLSRVTEVKLGRTATHLVVTAGPWSVWLPTDARAKYPDVAGVIPRSAPTTVAIDPSDAAALLPVLPGLPGKDDENRPVTLDADRGVRVRGRTESGPRIGDTKEMPLPRSTATGPAVRVALDRRVLTRALVLGCRTVRLAPDKPVVFTGDDVTFVAAQLDPDLCAPPGADETPTNSTPTPPERCPIVKPEPNDPAPPRGDPTDPLELAEDLRAALAEAAGRAARLVAALRQGTKQKKVLSALMTNLKQLNLGGTS
ncbi:hypothetical protein J8F10_21525 [Gemmata sp. G18]|uniref:Uncharacterized protein n=1 Tax=Gemmata palustris TaxID=2822762 RepID=A0ABS5BVU0_9BACT|nr:hypothetical protein [Gemmata palustris]MBP3957842.1 hypothetical protein [Gemmata palustris]